MWIPITDTDIINSFLSQNKFEFITEIRIPINSNKDQEEVIMKNGKFKGTGKGYGGNIIELENIN